jgi:MFS family permease
VGFKRVYVLAAGLLVMQTSLAILVDAPWVYYIIVFGIGGVYAANRTSDANFVFEIAPPAETSRFIGVSNTLLSPVLAASPLIGGMLVDKFSFMTLFTVNLVISIAALMITIFWLPEPRKAGGGAVATMIPAPAYSVVEDGELHSRSAESPKN